MYITLRSAAFAACPKHSLIKPLTCSPASHPLKFQPRLLLRERRLRALRGPHPTASLKDPACLPRLLPSPTGISTPRCARTASFLRPPEFSAKAHIKSLDEYEALYKQSIEDPEKFWAGVASELHWFKPWDKVLEWNLPWAKWFVGGKINLSYNCVDRHALREPRRQDRAHLGGRAGRDSPPHLRRTARRSPEVRQRAQVARHPERRSRRRLHGHDARAGHRPAGLRAHRRRPLRHLRRIRRQRHRRPRRRLRLRRHHHPGHELPPRQRNQAQGDRRRGHARLPHRQARRGLTSAPARR